MTLITSANPDKLGLANGYTRTELRRVRWPAQVLFLPLACLVMHCSDDKNASNASEATSTVTGTAGGGTSSSGAGPVVVNTSEGGETSGSEGALAGTGAAGLTSSSNAEGATTSSSGAGGDNAGNSEGIAGGVAEGIATTGSNSTAGGDAGTSGATIDDRASGGAAANNTGGARTAGNSDAGMPSAAAGAGGATSGASGEVAAAGAATGGTFQLTSPGWVDGEGCGPEMKTACEPLPISITRSGDGTSPELSWSGAPEGAESFVVLLQDLNNGTAHWILWNIPPTVTTLQADVDQTTATPATPAGSQQCGKGTGDGYYGPGAPCNVYEFVVYALSIAQFSPSEVTDAEAVRTQLQALATSILATASLRGRTDQGC